MTVRLCAPAFPGDKSTIFHAHQKVAHRADPSVAIEMGNHNASGTTLAPLRGWHPIEVLHFSFRSIEQLEQKVLGGWLRNRGLEPTLHQVLLYEAFCESRLDAFFEEHAVFDDELERGLAQGTLAIDTRLRDALRTLRESDGSFRLPYGDRALVFARPDISEEAAFAAEASVLVGIDGIVRAEERVKALEERLGALRTLPRR